jgi:hypothetical protein
MCYYFLIKIFKMNNCVKKAELKVFDLIYITVNDTK